jgi:quinol monooxygenase YgiN
MHSLKWLAIFPFLFATAEQVSAQNESKQMVRLAKLVIDSAQLKQYNAFLKEEIETSLKVESGVLTLYAVAEKERPTHITILEIYADPEAYKKHIQTPHFLKYKNGTKAMVKSLELSEVEPLTPALKIKQSKPSN